MAAMAAGSPVAPAPITTTSASKSQLAGMCPIAAPNAPGPTTSLPPVVIVNSLLAQSLFTGKALDSGMSIAPFACRDPPQTDFPAKGDCACRTPLGGAGGAAGKSRLGKTRGLDFTRDCKRSLVVCLRIV